MKSVFKVVIAGGRDFCDFNLTARKMDLMLQERVKTHQVVIISGGARGADKVGEAYANSRNFNLEIFPADWDKHGKSAGYKRNTEMAYAADAVVAFWDGKSRGTKHMIDIANKMKLPVRVIQY